MRATERLRALMRGLLAAAAFAVALLPGRADAGLCVVPTTQYGVHGGSGSSLSNMKINGNSLSPSGCTVGTCNSVAADGTYTQTTMTLPPVMAFQASSVGTTTSTSGTVTAGDYGTLAANGATFSGGTYRIGTLQSSGTLNFNAGTYYIDNFLGGTGSGSVKFTVSSGPVLLIIGTYMGSTANTHNMNDAGSSGDLQIFLEPGATMSFGNTVKLHGYIYGASSNNSVQFGNTATVTGGILTAGTITTGGTFNLTYGATQQSEIANLQGCGSTIANFLVEAAGGGAIGTQAAGQPFSIRVTARDSGNATVTAFTGTVVITSTGTLSLGGGTTANFVNGVLASHTVTVSNTGTFTITATQSGGSATGTSNAFNVVQAVGRFNAFEPATPANALTGVIKTKIAGQSFTLDIVGLNSAGTAYATQAITPITVELLDATNNSGALNGTTNCRASWTTLATVTTTFSLATSDNGRKSLAMILNRAAREVRVRISTTANGGVTGCSNDNFAVRPLSFVAVQATDANDVTTGTARVLNNSSASSGVVHRAGRTFTVLASAVNADGSTITTGYSAAPTLAVATCAQPAGCSAGTLSSTLAAVNGVVTGTATYGEAGVISVTMNDSTFAAIDAGDSTLAERTVTSTAATFGRFVPDAYQLSVSIAPQFGAPVCGAGPATQPFTYVGQGFSFGTVPVILATPLNAAGGALTNARPRFNTSHVSGSVSAAGAPVAFSASTAAANVTQSATSLITFNAGTFSFTRTSTPIASFTPTLSMTVNVADTTENGTAGNSTINALSPLSINPIAFAGGAGTFHYGRVQLRPAYGDVRRELYALLEVQRYNGLGWIALPDAGACLIAPATTFAYANATGLLDAGGGASNCASRVNAAVTTSGGRAAIRLDKPGAVTSTTPSAMTMTLNLLAAAAGTSCSGAAPVAATTVGAPWLANPDGTNPAARLTWGRLRGEMLGLRERFD